MAADTTYTVAIQHTCGGDKLVIASSGELNFESGSNLNIESGADIEIPSGADINIASGGDINFASGAGSVYASGSTEDLAGTMKVESGADIVLMAGARVAMSSGSVLCEPVRNAAYCGTSGTLPYFGTCLIGASSAAIVTYQLPVPYTCYLGSKLDLYAPAYDTINKSTHYYILANTSAGGFAVGQTTLGVAICWDSTYGSPISFSVIAKSTKLWYAMLPDSTGVGAGLIQETTYTT